LRSTWSIASSRSALPICFSLYWGSGGRVVDAVGDVVRVVVVVADVVVVAADVVEEKTGAD